MYYSPQLLALTPLSTPPINQPQPQAHIPHRPQHSVITPPPTSPPITPQPQPTQKTISSRQTFHAWKLRHSEIKEIFQKDLEVTASVILPQLQALLDNITHQTPQQRADATCKLVQTALHDTASAVLSSHIHTNNRTDAHTPKTPDNPK